MSVLRFKDPATNEWKEITTIMGPAGPQGPKGEDGGIKFEELTDAQKEELRGPQGIQGPIGPEGPQGIQGPKGETGETGPAGQDGAQGPKGDKGDTGERGPEGLQGPIGETGPEGPKGDKGDKGEQGETGPQGPEGPAGADGYTPVKGTDYFTEADKTELVADVKAQITVPSGANEISYDSTESQIEGIETVQKALDHLFDTAIDATYVENLGYQTEAQVNTLISTALGNIGIAEEGSY